MELTEAIKFIKPALEQSQRGQVWVDLGCGNGLFTRALATLLKEKSTVHAIDKSKQIFEPAHHGNSIVFHRMDFVTDDLPMTELNGVLMANSLHFVSNKHDFLLRLKKHLRHEGQLLIIEYEWDKGNAWVPYPIPYHSLKLLLTQLGFKNIAFIGERPSIYNTGKMYACTAVNSEDDS